MKIKCPICGEIFNAEENHISSHTWLEHDEEENHKAFYTLLIKIHEKIAELERNPRLQQEETLTVHELVDHGVLQVLKSLIPISFHHRNMDQDTPTSCLP